ncbi:4Fe-4S binding protein [Thermodesulfobacteriota bacterium]
MTSTRRFALAVLIVAACVSAFLLVGTMGVPQAESKEFTIKAHQYTYEPHRIVVNRGDEVHIRLAALDVVHGFFLEGYGVEAEIHPGRIPFKMRHRSVEDEFRWVEEIIFHADRRGKFRYRCSVTCGTLHPFMLGELIVRPNLPFLAGTGSAIGICIAAFVLMFLSVKHMRPGRPPDTTSSWRIDLLALIPLLKWLVTRKWLQFVLMLPALGFFMLFLIAGFWGSPIGNRNIAITVVWIFWWFLLITILLPFGSRVWCLLCPFPFFGEWYQRRRLLGPDPDASPRAGLAPRGFNKSWPSRLSNIWLQNIFFLVLCTLSPVLITRPVATALALGTLALLATLMHVIYRRRTFCLYVCPVGGFMSLYSMTSITEIRAGNPDVCAGCREKTGVFGSRDSWPCPWLQRPNKLERNNYCGFCMECIRACPHDNMTIRLRPFCADDRIEKLDEAWKAFIMISLAMVYCVVLLGPWGSFKEWANITEMGNWKGFALYVAGIWSSSLVIVPCIWAGAAWLGGRLSGSRTVSTRALFLRYSFLLVPLGLFAWIAFSLPLILINGSYVLTTLSDPLGWGWDLFGTAHLRWTPLIPEYIHFIQCALLLFALGFTLKRGYELSHSLYEDPWQGVRSLVPVGVLCTGMTIGFLTLFAG